MKWVDAKELAPLYALGALDKEFASQIDDFLISASIEQKLEFVNWQELAALLPVMLDPVPVPTKLRDKLLNIISHEFETRELNIASAAMQTQK